MYIHMIYFYSIYIFIHTYIYVYVSIAMPVMHGPDYWTTFDADIIGLAAFGFPFECVKGEKSEVYVCVCVCVFVCVCVCVCVCTK